MSTTWQKGRYSPDTASNSAMNTPVIIENEMPIDMYIKGNFRCYLDRVLQNAPLIRVKAYVVGTGVVTVTNESINGKLTVVNGINKSQVAEGDIVLFDEQTIRALEDRDIDTNLLKGRDAFTIEDHEDRSGIRTISQEILDKVNGTTMPPPRNPRLK